MFPSLYSGTKAIFNLFCKITIFFFFFEFLLCDVSQVPALWEKMRLVQSLCIWCKSIYELYREIIEASIKFNFMGYCNDLTGYSTLGKLQHKLANTIFFIYFFLYFLCRYLVHYFQFSMLKMLMKLSTSSTAGRVVFKLEFHAWCVLKSDLCLFSNPNKM